MAGNVQTNLPLGWANVANAQGMAQNYFNQGIGKPFKGPTVAPLNQYTTQALNQTRSLAGKPVPGLGQATAFNTGMMASNGMTPDLTATAGGIKGSTAEAMGGMREASGYLRPFANGSYYDDPAFNQLLDRQAERASTMAKTAQGGGRYGGAAFGAGLGQAVQDANLGAITQQHQFSRGQQLQAAGAMGGLAGQMGDLGLASGNSLANIYGQGLGRAFQASANLPALNELRYDGAARLAGVGDYYQQRAQQALTDKNAQTQAGNDFPWQNLNNFTNILTSTGGLGGTQFGKSSGPSTMQSTLGGALVGAGLGGKVGSAIPGVGTGLGTGAGALLGGLGGFFQ